MSGIPSPMIEVIEVEDDNNEEPGDVDSRIETQLNSEEFSYEWTLARSRYDEIRNANLEIRSPPFFGGTNGGHTWKMVVYPTEDHDGTEYLGIYLILQNYGEGDTPEVRGRFEFSVLDKNGRPMVKNGNLYAWATTRFMLNTGWGIPEFLRPEKFDEVLVNNSFQFKCQLRIEERATHRRLTGIGARRQFNSEKNFNDALCFANDVAQFYWDSESKDVTLSTSNGMVMAHKQVLMARSPVFKRMFAAGMKEKRGNLVSLQDFDKETVTGMLEWMYSGKTELLFPRAPWLLQIAEKYQLRGLKMECEQVLVENLMVENVMRLLLLGQLYNSPFLKNHAVAFLSRSKREVAEMSDFTEMLSNFTRAGLFVELFFDD